MDSATLQTVPRGVLMEDTDTARKSSARLTGIGQIAVQHVLRQVPHRLLGIKSNTIPACLTAEACWSRAR